MTNSFQVDASLLQSKGYAAIPTNSGKFLHTCKFTAGGRILYKVHRAIKKSPKRIGFGQYLNIHDAALIGAVVEQHAFIDFNDLKGLILFIKQLGNDVQAQAESTEEEDDEDEHDHNEEDDKEDSEEDDKEEDYLVGDSDDDDAAVTKKRKILPALSIAQPGDLTSIEMRVFGESYKNMDGMARIEKLEKEFELPKLKIMTMKQRVLEIEKAASQLLG